MTARALYYYSNDTISSKAVAGGDEQIHFQNEDLSSSFDMAVDGDKIGAIYTRQFGTISGFCFVTEPNYIDRGQVRYTDQYNLSREVALSPSGKWLVYDYLGFCHATAAGTTTPPNFCITNTETGERQCINGADFETPDFAPTGSRLVFAAKLTGQNEIWTADVQDDGSLTNYIQLTNGPANQPSTEPAWSSDGGWIIFQRDTDTSEGEDPRLYMVRANGTGLRPLNIAGRDPAWYRGAAVTDPPDPTGGPFTNNAFLPVIIR